MTRDGSIHMPADHTQERDGNRLFQFADEACYPCFALGGLWNGFDNVEVSKETRDLIAAEWAAIHGFDHEVIAGLLAIDPGRDGRICLGWSYATQLAVDGTAQDPVPQ